MIESIITIFCICDDLVKSLRKKDDVRSRVSVAEIMATAIVSAKYFGGNLEKAREFMRWHHYCPKMLSKSRLIRRIHSIESEVWVSLFQLLAQAFKHLNKDKIYLVDSFPVPVCSNVRVSRCKLYKNKKYQGYIASKDEYFYGIKVHMITTKNGEPIEFIIEKGADHDMKAFKRFTLNFEKLSFIFGDKAYNSYKIEAQLAHERQIFLIPQRKSNAKKQHPEALEKKRKYMRKRIESAFSCIAQMFPKKIHAVTAKGFELKIALFIFAYAISMI